MNALNPNATTGPGAMSGASITDVNAGATAAVWPKLPVSCECALNGMVDNSVQEALARSIGDMLSMALADKFPKGSFAGIAARPSPENQTRAAADSPWIKTPKTPLADAAVKTEPITISTFNTRYDQGEAAVGTVDRKSASSDIILLQEVKPDTLSNITSTLFDTHQPYVGQSHSGGYTGEFSPIYYNKERFEAVYTSSIKLNEKGELGAGSPRMANFVLLREKETGATVLVSNTHLDNFSFDAREQGVTKINAELHRIRCEFPVDSVIAGGDFNMNANIFAAHRLGLDGADYDPTRPTYKSNLGSDFDGILVSRDVESTTTNDRYEISDSGPSDHEVVSRDIVVTANADARKAHLQVANHGALLNDGIDYTGKTLILGFGAPEAQNTDWNDEISSVRVSEGASLTAKSRSQRDPDYAKPDTVTTNLKGNVAWVGADVNDTFSEIGVSSIPKPKPV